MKKIVLFLLVLIQLSIHAIAQEDKDMDRKELKELLDNRKAKFDSYSLSLEKHSGIFGNKTKNDVKKSNEVLIEIVKTDNRIISTLYRVVDFRTYEKVNMNYDIHKSDEVLNNLRLATDTLSKQVEALTTLNHTLKSRSNRLEWLIYALSFLIILMIIMRWRKRTPKTETNLSE